MSVSFFLLLGKYAFLRKPGGCPETCERNAFPGAIFTVAHLLRKENPTGVLAACPCGPAAPAPSRCLQLPGRCPCSWLAVGPSVLLSASFPLFTFIACIRLHKGKRGHSEKKGIYFQLLILKSTCSLCSVRYSLRNKVLSHFGASGSFSDKARSPGQARLMGWWVGAGVMAKLTVTYQAPQGTRSSRKNLVVF